MFAEVFHKMTKIGNSKTHAEISNGFFQYSLKTIHKTIVVDYVFSLGRPLSLFLPRIGIITSTVYYVREIRVRLCTVINCIVHTNRL